MSYIAPSTSAHLHLAEQFITLLQYNYSRLRLHPCSIYCTKYSCGPAANDDYMENFRFECHRKKYLEKEDSALNNLKEELTT
jgi:hypothetical protein